MARLAIRMPKMSMTMTEGEMGQWFVSVGDEIAVGDVVCDVMTDKVDMEVESTVAGTLVEIVHDTGMVPVGDPIAWVEGDDDGGSFGDLLDEPNEGEPQAPESTPDDQPAAEGDDPEPSSEPGTGIPPVVPRARALAREHAVDLTTVPASGDDGLIRVRDVVAVIDTTVPAVPDSPAPSTLPARTPAPSPAPQAGKASAPSRRAKVRAVVARTMEPSALIPQFTVWRELHLDAADRDRAGVSWTAVLLRAYAAALRQVPELLSRWEGGVPTEAGPPAIALAVATDRGLLVPTFVEPDLAGPHDLDAEIRQVVAGAHQGRVSQEYLVPANGSLSNLGGMGVDRFQALLTPPQASVLSLGAISRRPVAVPGGVGLALTVHAGLTVDHRVADGAHAADLLRRMADTLCPTH